ncbi:MAG: tail fiber domain-containing protein [Gorillibacterium sp.]|nr:tail fiber domain-containing protein [Gorillibacterium sp.]
MPNDMKRMNYFNGLLLKEEDLTLDQQHHKRVQRLHNRYFHDWGIVYGLEVSEIVGQTKVEVSPGLALNRVKDLDNNEDISQEILVSSNHPNRVLDLAGYSTSDQIYITVSYKEVLADPDLLKGGGKEIHVWEISDIKASSSKPKDACVDILLARVTLKHDQAGNITIEKVNYTDIDGSQLITKAVGGTTLKAKKIIIGSTEDSSLPYFSGTDEATGVEGKKLIVHAPMTEFTGSLRSGPINTYGNVDVNGVLTVTTGSKQALKVNASGDVNISGAATVIGPLSAKGGLEVSGGTATLDVQQVVVTGNMVTVNKSTSEKNNSGFEVCRKDNSSAKLVWDEIDKSWKIGTDINVNDPESGMHQVAYGADWEKLHNGSNVDSLHKHSELHSTEGDPVLSADQYGDIVIENSLTVSGSLLSKSGGLEVLRGETLPNAKIAWNEEAKKWQIGTVNGDMTDIPDGKQWEELTGGEKNADALHTHRQFHNDDKSKLALEIGADGNVNIPHELMIGETLTVNKLIVREEEIVIKKVEQEVTNSYLTVNKADDASLNTKGGLDVYRGSGNPHARLEWNDTEKKWKIGIEGSLSDIPYGGKWDALTNGSVSDQAHKHSTLSTSSGGSALAANDQGNLLATGNLEVNGTLQINSSTNLKANLNVGGSATIEGDLTVKGRTTYVNKEDLVVRSNKIELNKFEGDSSALKQSSIEVYRGKSIPSARLVWDENSSRWKLGLGDELSDIAYGSNWDALTKGVTTDADGLHKHSSLSSSDGNMAMQVNTDGNIEITDDAEIKGTLTVNNGADVIGGLAVNGTVTVDGNLIVKGTTTTVEREDLVITNNIIEINKFDGDVSNVDESGIEVYRGESQPSARIIWDESERKWKVGIGSSLENIASGSSWEKLTLGTNADSLHIHSQIYNPQSDVLAMSASAEGDIDVHHDLTVGSSLTVAGDLDVRGASANINTNELIIGSPQITLNKSDHDMASAAGGGLEIYRGIDQPVAQLLWDEEKDQWKIGTLTEIPAFTVDKDGNVNASGALQALSADIHGALTASSAAITGTLTVGDGLEILQGNKTTALIKWVNDCWKLGTADKTVVTLTRDGFMGVGTDNPTAALDVVGKALFRETEIAGTALFSGNIIARKEATFEGITSFANDLNSQNVIVNKKVTVKGSLVAANGLEASRGQNEKGLDLPNAKIVWNNDKKAWFYGDGVTQFELGVGKEAQKQNKLYNELLDATAISADVEGNVGIGTNVPLALLDVKIIGGLTAFSVTKDGNVGVGTFNPKSKLDVQGDASVTGVLTAGTLTAVNATISKDLTVSGNLTVNGDMVTINTATLEVEDNIVRVNKYPSQASPLEVDGGLEVFRGGTARPAQLLWNETTDQWMAGVADDLKVIEFKGHTHPEFADITGAMTIQSGNVGIGTPTPTAKLDVNGNAIIKGKVTAIDGEISNKLTASDATISNALAAKSAVISTTLTASDATISNALTAKSAVISTTLTASDATISNVLTAKDAEITGSLTVNQGIEVSRGTNPKAQIFWDEVNDVWQAGVAGNLKNLVNSEHTHQELTDLADILKIASGNIGIGTLSPTAKLDVNGDAAVKGKLIVNDVAINNSLTAKSATFSTTLAANSATISTSLTANSATISTLLSASSAAISTTLTANSVVISTTLTTSDAIVSNTLTANSADIKGSLAVSKGIELNRGTKPKAQVFWNETQAEWQVGVVDQMKNLAYSDHTHQELTNLSSVMKVAAGKIGIGTIAPPVAMLDVNGDAIVTGKLTAIDAAISGSLTVSQGIKVSRGADPSAQIFWDETNDAWQVGVEGNMQNLAYSDHKHDELSALTDAITVDVSKNVGIGKTAEAGYKLDIEGNLRAFNYSQTSSRSYKDNIANLPVKRALELLNKLKPVTFNYKADQAKRKNIGFIAEEVPDVFATSDHKSVVLMDIIGVLTTVVQKQQKETLDMQKQVKALHEQVAALAGA